MIHSTVLTQVPQKKHGWIRATAWVLGTLVALLTAAYFVATSGAVLKGAILPRVGKLLNAQITVSDASISPFSHVVLQNLRVQTSGTSAEPLATIAEVRLRYKLMDIIHGNIRVDEVTLVSPTISLVQNPDGSSNLDPILKSQQAKPTDKKAEPTVKASSKPLQIDLKKFALTDATFRQVKTGKNGQRELAELSHVNVTLDDVKNGQTGKLGVMADIRMENTNSALLAKLSGNYAFALAENVKPTLLKGNTRLEVTRADGALSDMAAFGTELDVEVTPAEIKGVALRFKKGDTRLGEVRVSGPFDMEKLEGRLSVELAGIDKQLLNMVGAKSGMDFGNTTISSTSQIELAKAGALITASGQLAVNTFQLTRTNQTTPQLNLRADYSVTVDRAQNAAVLHALTVTGTQNDAALLKAELVNPMQIGLSNASNSVGDSTLTLAVSNLNLADWKPFLGEVAPAGFVNVNARLFSQQGGKQLTFDFDSGISHLTVNAGSNQFTDATITVQASGKAADMKQFDLTNCKLEIARHNQKLVSASSSGTYDKASETADLQATTKVVLVPLLQAVPHPTDMSVAAGTVDLSVHFTQKQKAQAVTGTLTLANLVGRFGKNEVRALGTGVDFDVGLASRQVQIRKLTGKLTQGDATAASFDVSGTCDSGTTNADLQVTAQVALATLLQAVPLPGMTVSAGTVDVKSHVTQMQKAQAVTGSLALANLSGRIGTNELSNVGTAVDFDLATAAQQIQLRKLTGKLTQGDSVGGTFDVSGYYDPVKTNANLSAKLTDFNQRCLGVFLEPALGGKKIVSVSINGSVAAQYEQQGASAVKADIQMTNLVVKNPKGQFPATPLEAKMLVDASLRKQVLDMHQFQITLTPTARATNQLQLSGQLDMSQANAVQGNLSLVADSLDFTSYYDLFAGKQATAAPKATAAPQNTPEAANKEPDPIKLPFHNFTATASIRHVYLHEIDIADWQATVTIDGGHVVVNPFKLTLNDAPVNTLFDIDLGISGWKYDGSLSAQAIPLTPLVNTFQPERKGVLAGTLTAQAKISGAGITGVNLQKYLAGQVDMSATNLNIAVDNIQSNTVITRLVNTLIDTIAVIPDLVNNPASTATALLAKLTGSAGNGSNRSVGLTSDIQRSPINSIALHGTVDSGRVNLRQATVQSSAFEAMAHDGTITLNEVLTNSPIQIPIAVLLERSIAQRINLAGNTPTNATYAQLPDFLTMKGTLGKVKADVNYVALSSAVLQGVGGKGTEVNGAIQSISGLLTGKNATPSNSTTTPRSGGKMGNFLQGVGALMNNTTNAPAANGQAPAVQNLIKGFLGR